MAMRWWTFLIRDPENPSSVISSVTEATNNGRQARTAFVPRGVGSHQRLPAGTFGCAGETGSAIASGPQLLATVRQESALVRGGAARNNDAQRHLRLYSVGHFSGRGPNAPRILDVKYCVLLPSPLLRVTPSASSSQQILTWGITVQGGRSQLNYVDHHGNPVVLIELDGDQHQVGIEVQGEVETTDRLGVVGPHTGIAPLWLYLRNTRLTEPADGVERLLAGVGGARDAIHDVGLFHDLAARVADQVAYQGGSTTSTSTAEEALAAGSGVCQDHAHIFTSAARELGAPARYVSGYLMMADTDDQAASHAWAEVHLPDLGWVGFDVSNGICPDERYVRVATGLDYRDAAPISGPPVGGGIEAMDVTVRVATSARETPAPAGGQDRRRRSEVAVAAVDYPGDLLCWAQVESRVGVHV